jgi:integral membrane sensor domain MASE1
VTNQYPPYWWLVQACLVAILSYLTARLGGALILRPQMVSPFWLGNVVLTAVLLLVRREIRPVLLGAGMGLSSLTSDGGADSFHSLARSD